MRPRPLAPELKRSGHLCDASLQETWSRTVSIARARPPAVARGLNGPVTSPERREPEQQARQELAPRGPALLLLERFALFFRLLLQLLLQRLALLFQHFWIGRLTVKRRTQVFQWNVKRQLSPGQIATGHAHDDGHVLTFFQHFDSFRANVDFRRAGVLEAHVVLALDRLVLVDDDAEAGLQQHADRQDQEPQLAPLFAGHVKQVDADHRRLIGRRREVAHGGAGVTAAGRLLGAELRPLRLGRYEIDL